MSVLISRGSTDGSSTVRVTYDEQDDVAYLYVVDRIADSEVASQVALAPPHGEAEVFADFDRDGFLLGIEVIGARRTLRPEVLDASSPPE